MKINTPVHVERNTLETQVVVDFGGTKNNSGIDVNTGIGFFDHMLSAFAKHSGYNLAVHCTGDLQVDAHHTVEDVGIALGMAMGRAFSDKSAIARYGQAFIPMDEALAFCAVDIGGRAFLAYDCAFVNAYIGRQYEAALTEEFFRAVAFNAKITLHLKLMYGLNDHHKCEALFKAFAHAVRLATTDNNTGEILSTKGVL
jgi:imidazoleglycerol-phosphate dehydratase